MIEFQCKSRVVARGGRQGTDYAPHSTASPPGFKNLSTPLKSVIFLRFIGLANAGLLFLKSDRKTRWLYAFRILQEFLKNFTAVYSSKSAIWLIFKLS